jgi:hypothetical protein
MLSGQCFWPTKKEGEKSPPTPFHMIDALICGEDQGEWLGYSPPEEHVIAKFRRPVVTKEMIERGM